MLNYLDGYPIMLPYRYADKQACYTKVYLISNISPESQYRNIQWNEPATWQAFTRRIHRVEYLGAPDDRNFIELNDTDIQCLF